MKLNKILIIVSSQYGELNICILLQSTMVKKIHQQWIKVLTRVLTIEKFICVVRPFG